MASGYDKLVYFLLSEIALCGVQGAGSVDFHRFINKYYEQHHANEDSQCLDNDAASLQTAKLDRIIYERSWQWVVNHPDVRITHQNEVCIYSLSEFEAAETHETGTTKASSDANHAPSLEVPPIGGEQPSKALSAMRMALKGRLTREGTGLDNCIVVTPEIPILNVLRQTPRNIPENIQPSSPVFSDPDPNVTMPRLYASQSRTWQALTGHGIDLTRVPAMEFVLLSLIAAQGHTGIAQPDLTMLSGQDKRSVPHRTDELARKGYIVKNPVQAGKTRTSLCVHKSFVSQNHFLSSSTVEDVFQEGTFVLSGFVHLLYRKLKDAGVVTTREIRTKLGVPMRTWNKRATQGALIRLDQTGMIKRFRARKTKSEDSWAICIKVLREPREEDVNNLGFRRQVNATDDATEELLDEDVDGDTLMRDIEVDMLENTDGDIETYTAPEREINDVDRFPPQWTPDRFLANTVFDVIALSGKDGCDSGTIRDRIVGPFWRRPMESYLTRLTENWKKTQPFPVRHLAIIRDTRNTQEKKFMHYVYRSYENFEKAVQAGEVHWEGVSKPVTNENLESKGPNKKTAHKMVLDSWGFYSINEADLVRKDGSATLSEARSAIVHPRKYGPRWDNALNLEIGYQRFQTPVSKKKSSKALSKSLGPKKNEDGKGKEQRKEKLKTKNEDKHSHRIPKTPKSNKKISLLSLTPEQRTSLGLKPTGRLTKFAEKQIIAHRRESGDPTSLPDRIEEVPSLKASKQPLMTKEERIAQGLPARGRLGIEKENELRAQRGLAPLTKKAKKPSKRSGDEPPLLSKEQRLAFGWIGHGRLPQELMDGLRLEREDGIALKESRILPKYMDLLRAKAAKSNGLGPNDSAADNQTPSLREDSAPFTGHQELEVLSPPYELRAATDAKLSITTPAKRKTRNMSSSSQLPKKQRMNSDGPQEKSTEPAPLPSPDGASTQAVLSGSTAISAPIAEVSVDEGTSTAHGDRTTPFTSTSMGNSLTTNVQVRQLSTLPDKLRSKAALPLTLIEPEVSSLPLQAQAIYSQYMSRSAPGLYLNRFAKHKLARGRPRNAFIATFRLPQLQDSEWLKGESNRLRETLQKTSEEEVANSPNPVTQQIEHILGPSLDENAEDLSTLEPSQSTLQAGNYQLQQSLKTSGSNNLTLPANSDVILHIPPASPETTVQSEQPVIQDDQELVPGAEPEGSVSQSPQMPILASSEAVDLTAIDTPTESEPPLHQSPCASNSGPTLPTEPNESGYSRATHTIATTESISQTPVEEEVDLPVPEGLCSAISEVEPAPPPEPRPRSKRDTITEGSALIFRRMIIREIIDLCGGVFPDGGEIARPFHAIWVKRHGHLKGLKEPIASTVNSTMRDMCNYPKKFGLKRMSFLTKHKNSPLTSTRSIITYANLTRSSPEVLQLASDMANFSTERSHQYFPEQIRHLCDDRPTYHSQTIAPKDDSIILYQSNPELEANIKEAQNRRRRERTQQKRDEEKARRIKDARVESVLSKHGGDIDDASSGQRARLASLNDTTKRYRVLLPKPTPDLPGKENEQQVARESASPTPDVESEEHATREPSPESDSSEDVPLIWMPPIVAPLIDRGSVEQEHVTGNDAEPPRDAPIVNQKVQKRVRITVPSEIAPKKKARFNIVDPEPALNDDYVQISSDESDESSLSEGEEEDDEDSETGRPRKRKRAFKGRQKGKLGPLPTLLERLTGLTGDPNDPIYQPPERKFQLWSEKKKNLIRDNKQRKARKYIDSLGPIDKFRKLCCTLAIASSMTGENGVVDWGIVEKVYRSDKFFNIAKARKLWTWMQFNMAPQLDGIIESFQSAYLEAYEDGKMSDIDDPETYDWENLVCWAVRTCKYPHMPLPAHPETLSDFVVEKSGVESLDRAKWYRERIVDRTRTRIQNRTTFVLPLHGSPKLSSSSNDETIKARSWVRANTATLQTVYDAYQAHDKFKALSELVLANVVGDYVEKQALRMRKLKRLLPGRNYNFTHAFAKKFARPFEFSDFMLAVKSKKDMDIAFAAEDTQERFYSVSHFEENGSIIVIHDLLSQGKVRLVPQLPPVNHEFKAPLPRLSVWGFNEGSYLSRKIDKNRMFWDIHVVPTAKYQFGSPLQPLPSPPAPTETGQLAEWRLLPDPPLPGHNDDTALLPIWSSIDGQTITWPWWYRILNLILQPLIFQPGATASHLFAHCPEHTTELFEVELILGWLESVGAVSKTIGGGYMTAPGFWAVFGDKPLDTDDDWFGEAVKRKTKMNAARKWREEYNLRHSALLARDAQSADSAVANGQDGEDAPAAATLDPSTREAILENPKRQYRIVRQALNGQTIAIEEPSLSPPGPLLAGIEAAAGLVDTGLVHTPGADIDMVSTRGEDVDAEGEDDDELYASPV